MHAVVHLSFSTSNWKRCAQSGSGLQLFQTAREKLFCVHWAYLSSPKVGHPEQLISRVVVVVKDLQLQPEVLFMWANLGNNFDFLSNWIQIIGKKRYLCSVSLLTTSRSLMRKSAQSGFKQFFLVSDFLSTWIWHWTFEQPIREIWACVAYKKFKPGNFL